MGVGTDSIEELTAAHRGVAASSRQCWVRCHHLRGTTTDVFWERCVHRARWRVNFQAPSAPVAELTAAAAVGLLLEEENVGTKVRRVHWTADSTNALDVASHARAAQARVQKMTRAETRHIHRHTGEPGNECADVTVELGGLRRSLCLSERLLHCVHQRLTKKPDVQTLDLDSILHWSRVPDRNAEVQPSQAQGGRRREVEGGHGERHDVVPAR